MSKGDSIAPHHETTKICGVELMAGPEVIVPHKEMKLLGNAALDLIKKLTADHHASIVIDICTGAGNLSIAYAVLASESRVYGAELSADAQSKKQNAEFVRVYDVVGFSEEDLLTPFDEETFLGSIDLLSCNPPYMSSAKVDTMHEEIAIYEPRLAVDDGPFGIQFLQRLVKDAPRYIKPGG
jgi:release factor glutamine methyltransferase